MFSPDFDRLPLRARVMQIVGAATIPPALVGCLNFVVAQAWGSLLPLPAITCITMSLMAFNLVLSLTILDLAFDRETLWDRLPAPFRQMVVAALFLVVVSSVVFWPVALWLGRRAIADEVDWLTVTIVQSTG